MSPPANPAETSAQGRWPSTSSRVARATCWRPMPPTHQATRRPATRPSKHVSPAASIVTVSVARRANASASMGTAKTIPAADRSTVMVSRRSWWGCGNSGTELPGRCRSLERIQPPCIAGSGAAKVSSRGEDTPNARRAFADPRASLSWSACCRPSEPACALAGQRPEQGGQGDCDGHHDQIQRAAVSDVVGKLVAAGAVDHEVGLIAQR